MFGFVRVASVIFGLYNYLELPVVEIAEFFTAIGMSMHSSTIYRHTRSPPRVASKKRAGRPGYWTPEREARLMELLEELQEDPGCDFEVTSSLLKRKGKFRVTASSVRRKLSSLGFRWVAPKPLEDLSLEDVNARFCFSREYASKTFSYWWNTLILDEKKWEGINSAMSKQKFGRMLVRGVWAKRSGPRRVRQSRPRKGNLPTTPPTTINGGFFRGRCVLWEAYDGGQSSETFCEQVLEVCHYYGIKRVLCDCHKAHVASDTFEDFESAGVELIHVPKRSPDLSPCDFGWWSVIGRLMMKRCRSGYPRSLKAFRTKLYRAARDSCTDEFFRGLLVDGDRSLQSRINLCFDAGGGRFVCS